MQIVSCEIALGGDIRSTIIKHNVTLAELVVYRYKHGDAAVTNISLTGENEIDDLEERDRLGAFFTDEDVVKIFGGHGALPQTLVEARIVDELMAHGETVKAPVKKATTTAKRKRARNADGTLKGDDPSTPNVNEAYEKENENG
jgi:hypothetical protein